MKPKTKSKRRILMELWIPGTLAGAELNKRLRPELSERSLKQARAELSRGGQIVRSRRGARRGRPGTPTWTIRKANIDGRLMHHVYGLVVAACIDRGERPPQPPALYRLGSPQHDRTMREYRHACDRADEMAEAIEAAAQAGIDAKTAARYKRQYEEAIREYLPPTPAVRWSGPDILGMPSRGDDSLGVPR
ncbi:MAG TPA: hypothetical protein VFE36_16315 [Candidatus Baltobacteraceae bacterium]|jgi:hypothetical protein|nr:hypothetical protein [Candidatus Baltobacteraceae bacterium]